MSTGTHTTLGPHILDPGTASDPGGRQPTPSSDSPSRPTVSGGRARHRNVRRRLAVLFTVGTAVSLVLCSAALFVVLERQVSNAIDDGLRARLGDLEAVVQRTHGQTDDRDPFAQVVTPSGKVIAWSPGDQKTRSALTLAQIHSVTNNTFFDGDIPEIGGSSRVLAKASTIEGTRYVLVVASPLDPAERVQRGLTWVLLVLAPLLTVAVASAGWWLAGAALRPVKEMTDEVNAITSLRELDRRISETDGSDEVAELSRTLNDMLARLQRAVEHERGFVDDASHELRTPISILQAELELLRGSADDQAEVERGIDRALADLDRLRRLSQRLLELARVDAGQVPVHWQVVDLHAHAVDLARAMQANGGVHITVVGDPVTLTTDPDLFLQVLTNLLSNARLHAGSAIQVSLEERGGNARVVVSDDGPGFAPSLLPLTFARFVRGDPSRNRSTGGTGLGLAVAASLVELLGGSIRADNDADLGGARVVIELPGEPGLER